MRKSNSIKLDDLKWEPVKIIGPPFRIFLENNEIVRMEFGEEEDLDTPDETNPYYSKLIQKERVIDFDKDTFRICLMGQDRGEGLKKTK